MALTGSLVNLRIQKDNFEPFTPYLLHFGYSNKSTVKEVQQYCWYNLVEK